MTNPRSFRFSCAACFLAALLALCISPAFGRAAPDATTPKPAPTALKKKVPAPKKSGPGLKTAPLPSPTVVPVKAPTPTPKKVVVPVKVLGPVLVVPISGAITSELAEKVEETLTAAVAKKARLVILQLDTLGGNFSAMERIRKALLRSKVRTVAFVDKQAIGLGAVVAYACDLIVFSSASSMGAAGALKNELKPVQNLLRTVIRSTAEAKGRDGKLALAMIDPSVDVKLAPKGRLLTVTTRQALELKLANFQAEDIKSLLARLKLSGASINRTVAPEPVQDPNKKPTTKPTKPLKPKLSTVKYDLGGGKGKTILIVPIKGEIEQGLAPYLVRVIKEAEQKKVDVIILHIDTPGGRVDSMNVMRKALLRTKIKTVAFVDKEAISAGAVIAYACNIIVFASAASMGAATPIQVSQGKAKPVGEKIVSWMRAVIRSTAEKNGRNGKVAEAMVDAKIDLPPLAPKGKLLTITTKNAIKYGVADFHADNMEELFKKLNIEGATVLRPKLNWAEKLGRFLTSMVVSSILMSIGGLALLIGLYTGSVMALSIGIGCFVLFFVGHYAADLAGYEEAIILLIGVALLLVEVLVIPGFGVTGVLGILCILASLILSMSGLDIPTQWETQTLSTGLLKVSISVAISAVLMFVFGRYFPQTTWGKRLVLATSLDASAGFVSEREGDHEFLGKEGVATTDLRPAGKVEVEGKKLDVVSMSGFVKKGKPIVVVEVSFSRIVVREKS